MKILIGIFFFVALSLFTAFIIYTFLTSKKPKHKKKPKARPKAIPVKPHSQVAVRAPQRPVRSKYELPPDVPRDINTLRIIAKEDPEIIIDIIRKWMKQR